MSFGSRTGCGGELSLAHLVWSTFHSLGIVAGRQQPFTELSLCAWSPLMRSEVEA